MIKYRSILAIKYCLVAIIAFIIYSGNTVAAKEICSTLYTGTGYSGSEYKICSNNADIQHFYSNSDFPDELISSIKIAPEHALEISTSVGETEVSRTYYSSVVNLNKQLNKTISSVRVIPFKYDDFSIAFMAAPRYPWSCKNGSQSCNDKNKSWQDNENHVHSLNAIRNNLGRERFAGVVINGNLTDFGHKWQLNGYKKLYHEKLEMNIYPGLGDHDISDNVNSCFENNCASRMVVYLSDHVKTLNVASFDYHRTGIFYNFPSLKKTHSKSLAYSWDIGKIHFIQLNNYPTYTAKWNAWNFSKARRDYFNLQSARDWLIKDLEKASKEGKHIILNYNISNYTDDIKDILRKFKVSAIFAGHLQDRIGLMESHTLWDFYGPNKHLPVFIGGSAVFQKYLLVNFKKDCFEVSIIKSNNGTNYETMSEGVYPLY